MNANPLMPAASPANWLTGQGGGDMGRRVRAFDWSSTPPGPIDAWPTTLRVALGICLNSRFPMRLWWGDELVTFYNDAYAPILGKRHPAALGMKAQDVWGEIWPEVGPQAESVMRHGASTWNERAHLFLERNGYPEDAHITWSCSPITDDQGQTVGLICACMEETALVIADRERMRLDQQRQLALDAAGMGWWHLDLATNISTFDTRFAEIFGVEGRRLENGALLELIARADLPAVMQSIATATDPARRGAFTAEYHVKRPDGVVRCIEAHGVAIFDGATATSRPLALVGTVADVTGRRDAEERVRASEARRALAVEAGALGTFYCPLPLAGIEWNDTCKAHFWLPPEADVTIDLFFATLHPEDREATRQAIERSIAGDGPMDVEYRTVAPDGRCRWIRARGSTYFDNAGQAVRFDGVTIDISDQKRLEASLRDSERRFREMADTAPAMLWITEPDGYCSFLSRGWYEFTGQTEAQALGYGWAEAAHPEDFQAARDAFIAANAQRREYAVDFRLRRADGVYRWVVDAGRPRFGQSGEFLGFIGAVIDIDDRKHAQEQSTAILESIAEAFFAIDRDWRFTYVNRRAEQLLGRLTGDLLGKALWAEFPGMINSPWEPLYHSTMREGKVNSLTTYYPDHDRWYEVHLYPATEGVSVYFLDVSERRRAEVALQQVAEQRETLLASEQAARAEAERAGRMKDEFLATLSHELRTPLNAILGWSQIMGSSAQSAEDIAQGLQIIERNARAQTQIIEDLLDMSRIISGKVRIDVRSIELADVIRAAIEAVRPAADAKALRIQTTLDPLAHPITGDPGRLQQVFWNILSNAVKFTPKGGRVRVSLERVESQLEVSISDTGEGIKPEFLPHMFDRFRQADSSTTRRHGGLGLGLAIVKQLVELHGGRVGAKSDGPGQGTTFNVTLPLTPLQRPSEGPLASKSADSVPEGTPEVIVNLTGVNVLVVDDEADARGLLQRLLTDRGAAVSVAGSCAAALDALRGAPINVLVTDIGMPEQDGYTLIRAVRALPGERGRTPALALTAYARAEDRVKSIIAGFQMHIAKPVDPAELLAMVASLAGRMND